MAKFCLLPRHVTSFLKGLRSGEIDPDKLSEMSSDKRREFFAKYVSESEAQNVNALFESKLLQKNKIEGMKSWVRKVAGMQPKTKRDLFAKIDKLGEVLNPEQENKFLEDLVKVKLGIGISESEAKTVFELNEKIKNIDKSKDRMSWGRAKVALANYVSDIKIISEKRSILDMVKDPIKTLSDVAGAAKSMKASLDNSALLRQGWRTLITNPKIWLKNAALSFKDMADTFGGKQVLDEVNADIISRPSYDDMVRAKLAISTLEESYPSTFPEKIPVLKKFFKASEVAFTAFMYRTRADVFDSYLNIAKNAGVNLKEDNEIRSIGKLVNSLTVG